MKNNLNNEIRKKLKEKNYINLLKAVLCSVSDIKPEDSEIFIEELVEKSIENVEKNLGVISNNKESKS
jgi:hypothetical protein